MLNRANKEFHQVWGVNDVLHSAGKLGIALDDDQAWQVLVRLNNQNDASVGICWDTIETLVKEMYGDCKGEPRDFEVDITRVGFTHITVIVTARSAEQAIGIAEELSSEYAYYEEADVQYEVTGARACAYP